MSLLTALETHQNWLVMMKPSGIQFSEPQR